MLKRGLTVMGVSARNTMVLSHFEREYLPPEVIRHMPVTGLIRLRYEQDLSLLRLITFRTGPDPTLLRAFLPDNAGWLQTYVDASAYDNQIAVLRYLGESQAAAQSVLTWDERFRSEDPAVPRARSSASGNPPRHTGGE